MWKITISIMGSPEDPIESNGVNLEEAITDALLDLGIGDNDEGTYDIHVSGSAS